MVDFPFFGIALVIVGCLTMAVGVCVIREYTRDKKYLWAGLLILIIAGLIMAAGVWFHYNPI